ncbi:MAG: sigma-70 family RNA polymerase sigma factor [Bacteroidales bacterium]|nr:sigma-70 family RNA polymerase sigma factor [Bacteroidales bacterium]
MDLQRKILSIEQKKLSEENNSDSIILQNIKAEHTKMFGFRMLVDTYKEQIYWQARRNFVVHEDADDVTQNVFIKIWKNIDKFRGDAKLASWIYRITANEIINFVNNKNYAHSFPTDEIEKLDEAFSLEYFSGDEVEKVFQKTLLNLPPRQRLVFTMRYYDETPFDQIAEQLELSTGAVKASYHHAAEKIKKWIGKEF